MVTASELGRLEGKIIEQVHYDGYDLVEITVSGGVDWSGPETLRIKGEDLIVRIY